MFKVKELWARTLLLAIFMLFVTFYLFVRATLTADYMIQRDEAILALVDMGYSPTEAACALRDDSHFLNTVCKPAIEGANNANPVQQPSTGPAHTGPVFNGTRT